METPCDAAPPDLEVALADDRFVRALARRLARGVDPDDLAQDAWLAALRRRPDRPGLRGWMTRAVAHLAIDRSRERDRRARREERAARSEVAPETALVEREEVRKRVVAGVLALGRPASTVLTLRYFEDLSPRDIARRLAMPPATVRSHLKRGLAKLRERLAADRDARGRPTLALLPLLFTPRDVFAAALGAVLMSAKGKAAAAVVVAACVIGAGAAMTAEDPRRASLASETDASPPSPREASEADRANRPTSPGPIATVAAEPFRDETPHAASAPASLGASCVVRGRVLDADGRPAAGCRVAAVSRELCGYDRLELTEPLRRMATGEPPFAETGGRRARTTSTDAEGRFLFDGVPSSHSLAVAAADPNLGATVRSGFVLRSGATVDVELTFDASTTLFGNVYAPDGAPLGDVSVSVYGMRLRRPELGATGSFFVRTDAEGAFRTAPLPIEGATLQVQLEGALFAAETVDGISPAERERRVDFRLRRAPLLSGRLRTPDGALADLGAWNAALRAQQDDRLLEVFGSADDPRATPGTRLEHMRGSVFLDASAWQLYPAEPAAYVSLWVGSRLVACEPTAGRETFDIVVDAAKLPRAVVRAPVRVRVVDPDGATLRARVALIAPPASGHTSASSAAPDADGVHVFGPVAPTIYDVEAEAPGFESRRLPLPVAEGPDATEAVLTLRPATASIRLHVLGPEGPVRAWVRLFDDRGHALPSSKQANGNVDGVVVVDGLAADTYLAAVQAPRLAPVVVKTTVGRGASTSTVRLAAGVAVEVRVLDAEGPFAFRYLDGEGRPFRDDVSTHALLIGNVERHRFLPGRMTVEVHAACCETAVVPFEAREGTLVLVPMRRKS